MAKTTPRKKASGLAMTLTYETCTIFSTVAITCPLCKGEIPPGMTHECRRPVKDGRE